MVADHRVWCMFTGMPRLAILLLCLVSLVAQPVKNGARFTPFGFLAGEWVGESGGGPGQGSGEFSFLPDQDGKILIRKNFATYPATKGKPAFSHTDLMIIYQESGESKLRAIYFDDEDHIIHYIVEPSADRNSVQLVTENSASQPGYRLTYRKSGDDRVTIQFEIAPAGKGDAFSTYIQATARRKQR